MNVALAFVRSFTIRRIFLATVLTTVACAIIKPYFLMEVTFYALWLRLFIVAIVMLIAYVVTESVYPLVPAPRLKLMHAQFIAMTLGSVLGTIASGLAIGRSLEQMMTTEPILWGMIFFTGTGIAFGVLTVTVLRLREQAARAEADIARADSQRQQLEKQVLEARLKLMQAQIEPHFLFNTLANVQHLVEANPPVAARTLESLITYLRAALPEMREGATTLGREADMAQAYLEIQQIRMGARLTFGVAIPPDLRARPFPPMMLMTLVENAVKHGIDPLQHGGDIQVSAAIDAAGALDVRVTDNGQGLAQSHGMGIGLQNIRERLAALFGKEAKLLLEEHAPRGLVARIVVNQKPE